MGRPHPPHSHKMARREGGREGGMHKGPEPLRARMWRP
ncbi:hypothetical protein Pmani_009844 [Petrolisthes manimaculis]|uniref:Uncharacterized protein n=1 Tax=Petrolisthes manimaculis TaxID=1843537 RepID=A0AAE1UD99_9EUCA|nr:hypothetical protein Pmani_009844 [Petrolisthes manimaculis]